MSDCNNEYVLKRGEVGSLMNFTLSDENGAVNLTGWSVVLTAKKGSSTPVIDEAACTILGNQSTTNTGKGTYEFDSTTANIAAGTYNLEFKATNPSGDIYYFPKTHKEPFALLYVVEPLS